MKEARPPSLYNFTMAMRPHAFAPGEVFHCYNRGVDKRTVFENQQDYTYFVRMLRHFNTSKVVGSLKDIEKIEPVNPPVTILAYCILPNHYHLVVRCNDVEGGLSKFMQRVGGGYTMYFNQRYERSGSLFQGKFKARLVDSDYYLKNILAYVTYNYIVHDISDKNLYRSGLNFKDDMVRGLASSFDDGNMIEIARIIKDMRNRRQDLPLEGD
jgi:putative transposase